jgi:hypothetical protein
MIRFPDQNGKVDQARLGSQGTITPIPRMAGKSLVLKLPLPDP